jgi:hypothetical protein
VCSTVNESPLRVGGGSTGLSFFTGSDAEDALDFNDVSDGFRGGKGGAFTLDDLGGEKWIRASSPLNEACVGVFLKPFERGGDPSSSTHSFRSILKSMSDDLRPRFGGDGDGETFGGVEGITRGDKGVCSWTARGPESDSKALIRDCSELAGIPPW